MKIKCNWRKTANSYTSKEKCIFLLKAFVCVWENILLLLFCMFFVKLNTYTISHTHNKQIKRIPLDIVILKHPLHAKTLLSKTYIHSHILTHNKCVLFLKIRKIRKSISRIAKFYFSYFLLFWLKTGMEKCKYWAIKMNYNNYSTFPFLHQALIFSYNCCCCYF